MAAKALVVSIAGGTRVIRRLPCAVTHGLPCRSAASEEAFTRLGAHADESPRTVPALALDLR